MPLSSKELTNQLRKSDCDQTAGQQVLPGNYKEQRAFPRFPFRGRAKAIVFPPPTGPANATTHDSEVITNDLSRGGVSILHRGELVRGQQLMLMLHDTTQLVEVRWSCRVWDGLFAAGCQFLNSPQGATIDERLQAIDVVISDDGLWGGEEENG
jgi:PilZ domain-containing protein